MTKGDQTRQRIVSEAAALFNRRGFEGSSMADLMSATGLEKGGIYRHFASKEEIASEAFDFAWQAARDVRLQGLDSAANSVDWLKQFVANFVERRSPVPGGCPLLNTAIDSDDGNSVLRTRAQGALKDMRGLIENAVKRGIAAKEIRASVVGRDLANLVISVLEGALMISLLERDRQPLANAQSHLNHYFELEIRAQHRRSRPHSRISTK